MTLAFNAPFRLYLAPAEDDAPVSERFLKPGCSVYSTLRKAHPASVQGIPRWLSVSQNVDIVCAAQRLALTIRLPYSWWVCSSQLCHPSHVI